MELARRLANKPFDVVLLDRNNYHLFTPFLYQVASSLINPGDIAYPVRTVFRRASNVRFRMAEVVGVDFQNRRVRLESGPEEPYEHLIFATGVAIHYFGQEAIRAISHGLTDLPMAMRLRNHVLTCFETAAVLDSPEKRREWLTFMVVGAGPTGVEYAGALSELVRLMLRRDHPRLPRDEIHLVLVEGRDRVLPIFPEGLSHHAEHHLRKKGIELRLGRLVNAADGESVTLDSGEVIRARTLVWAAGVHPPPLIEKLGLPVRKSGRVEVDEYLRVPGYEGVYAIGDVAGYLHEGEELPMLSPPAMQQARLIAANLQRAAKGQPARTYRYFDKGLMATIGRNVAVAQSGPIRLKGFIGWVAWLALHLYFLAGFRNRVAVFARWIWEYILWDRPIRFILRTMDRRERA